MKSSDREKFALELDRLAEVYGVHVTERKAAVYWDVLEPWPIEQIQTAVLEHLRGTASTSTFFPKPADLIRLIKNRTMVLPAAYRPALLPPLLTDEQHEKNLRCVQLISASLARGMDITQIDLTPALETGKEKA